MKIVNWEYLDFQQAMEAVFWAINNTSPESKIGTLFGIIELNSLRGGKSFNVRRSDPNYKRHSKRVETDFFRVTYRSRKNDYASNIASLTMRIACNVLALHLTDGDYDKKIAGEFFAYALNNYSMLPFVREFRRRGKSEIIKYLWKDLQNRPMEEYEESSYDYEDFEEWIYELYDKFDFQIVQAVELYEKSLKTIGYELSTEFQILFGYLMNIYEISSENLEKLMNDIKKIHERTSTVNVVILLKQIMILAKYRKYI